MGPNKLAEKWRRRYDERGAELVEFAIVFSLILLPLFYGIVSYGCIFLVKTSVTQAADDASRAGLAQYNYDIANNIGNPQTDAENVASKTVSRDLNWLSNTTCTSSTPTTPSPVQCVANFITGGSSTTIPTGASLTCAAAVTGESDTCFYVSVVYGYGADPLIPTFPFMKPSTMTSTATQLVPNAP